MIPKYAVPRLVSACCLLFVLNLSHATVVRMDFAIGNQPDKQIFIEMLDLPFPDGAPQTVANFLRYIEYTDPATSQVIRRYDNTLIHRSVADFVIQGGGFTYIPVPGNENLARDLAPVVIDQTPNGQDKTVPNEFAAVRSNVRGTIAMAKVDGDPDSATSQWFINIGDNTNLDSQNGGFTVFGRVIGMTADNAGTTVADEIAALAAVDIRAVDPAFSALSSLPLFGYNQGDPVPVVDSTNLVRLKRVTVVEPVQPSVLDFGVTLLNSTSPAQTVTVQNLTDSAFTVSALTADLLAAPFSLSSETCSGATLLPLQTCTLFITFTPTEAGVKSASFNITTDSPALPSLPVSVTGTGAPQAPTVSFSPPLGPTLEFGSLGPGQDDRTLELTISNLGIDTLTIDARPFSGTGTDNLALNNPCAALATGESCTLSITFSHLLTAIETAAQLEILTNDPTAPRSVIQIAGFTSSDNDGISDLIEAAVSASGDGNLDGIADVLQDSVASLPDTFGRYITLAADPGMKLAGVQAITSPAPDTTPRLASGSLDFRHGFIAFQLNEVPVGGAATVTLYLPEGETATHYFKFGRLPSDIIVRDPVVGVIARPPHWYDFSFDGRTGAEIQGNRIILHFRDGERGDDDLTANGSITDPGGPALASASGSSGGGGGGCSLSQNAGRGNRLPVDLILLLVGMLVLRLFRQHRPSY
ncbi:MAG TPA: choice-of-anchor D domain-containing protein [Gammaproteobacteria bacterium]|nr:choice-of-anchor D domain-containing protein [Gammaproteobacteria bacterium]